MHMQTLTFLTSQPIPQLNPFALDFTHTYYIVDQLSELLVRMQNGYIVPALAKAWKIENQSSVTFYLNENSYNAEEVKQSFERIITYGQTHHSKFSTSINKIDVVNASTIKFHTAGNIDNFIQSLTIADASIIPTNMINQDLSINWSLSKGLYYLSKGICPVQVGDSLLLKVNIKHYQYNKNLPNIKILKINQSDYEKKKLYNILRQNSPAITTSISATLYNMDDKNLPSYISSKFSDYMGLSFFLLNKNSKKFSDKEIRLQFLNKILNIDFSVHQENIRAFQIGYTGEFTFIEENNIKEIVSSHTQPPFNKDFPSIKIGFDDPPHFNTRWLKEILNKAEINYSHINKTYYSPEEEDWKLGHVDATFMFIGIPKNSDPISSHSILFSTSGLDADSDEGDVSLIEELNSLKGKKQIEIEEGVKRILQRALLQGIIIPVEYIKLINYQSNYNGDFDFETLKPKNKTRAIC